MQFLVTTRSGGTEHKIFDSMLNAEYYYNQNKNNNAILTTIFPFYYGGNPYFYSQGDSGVVCIESGDFQYILKFKPKNIWCVDYQELIDNLDSYMRNFETPY